MKDLLELILAIRRTGSNDLRNHLLSDLKTEAYKIARIHLGREPTDEEFSVALRAMNEAIDRYDQNKNAAFGSFASTIIFHRLINFFRKQRREQVLFDDYNITILEEKIADVDDDYIDNLRDELARFNKIIGYLGYKWADIRKNRPKHRDTLGRILNIAILIVHLGLGQRFIKENPISRQLKKLIGSSVDQRTLKRYRPYLCSVVIAYIYDFPLIRRHIDTLRREVNNGTPQGNSRRDTGR